MMIQPVKLFESEGESGWGSAVFKGSSALGRTFQGEGKQQKSQENGFRLLGIFLGLVILVSQNYWEKF